MEIIRDQKKVMRRVPIVREKLAAPVGTKDPTLSAADNELFQKPAAGAVGTGKTRGDSAVLYLFRCHAPGYVPEKAPEHGDMRQVSGVGVIKAQKYGKSFWRRFTISSRKFQFDFYAKIKKSIYK